MVRLCVLDILHQKGLTKYWLYTRMDLSYQNFNKMVNNETKSIRFENIEKLCVLLECTANDIFAFCNDEIENS